MKWDVPKWGAFCIAVPSKDYVATCEEVEGHFGRPLARYSSWLSHEGKPYVVFSFPLESDAKRCPAAFNGEVFDPRDKGRGVHWGRWYKGRAAKRDRNRSPYDFR